MASHRRPKQPSRARATLFGAAATAAATVGITAATASADPRPSKEEVQERVDELYEEAEEVTEQYNGTREQQERLQEQVNELQDSTARAQQELNELRATLGSFASAQYRNGGLDPSVQLFLASDPDAYLDQASTLDRISGRQAEMLRLIEDRQRTLDQQRQEASEMLAQLEDLRAELAEQKDTVQGKLAEARALLNQLTEEERAALQAEEARQAQQALESSSRASRGSGHDATGSSWGVSALNFAAGKLGAPYVWGATGPDSFDCSGLTSWAYAQAGVSLPRTSQAQASAGTRVGRDQLAPGDLVFYYSGLTHVGIYAGNGQIIHAPRTGSVVSYAPLDAMPFQFGVHIG